MPPEEKIKAIIDDWGIAKIPEKFGRDYNKTMGRFHTDFGEIAESIVAEHLQKTYGNEISTWKDEARTTAKGKAFRKLSRYI